MPGWCCGSSTGIPSARGRCRCVFTWVGMGAFSFFFSFWVAGPSSLPPLCFHMVSFTRTTISPHAQFPLPTGAQGPRRRAARRGDGGHPDGGGGGGVPGDPAAPGVRSGGDGGGGGGGRVRAHVIVMCTMAAVACDVILYVFCEDRGRWGPLLCWVPLPPIFLGDRAGARG